MWHGLEEFLTVVETGSFTQAAKKLKVSTSHISRQVSALEDRLGLPLLNRTTRTVTLTDAGLNYSQRLQTIRQELEDATNFVQGIEQAPTGIIRISGAGAFVTQSIVPLLTEFCHNYPQISIDLNYNDRRVDLVQENYDLAIRFGRLRDSNLIARPLSRRPMTLVASPAYLSLTPEPQIPEDLKHHNCLTAVTNRWRFQYPDGIKEIKVSGNWNSNNADALLKACHAGLGIAHLAYDIVGQEIESGSLIALLEDYQVSDNATWLVYPRKDLIPHRVKLLIDFLVSKFHNAPSKS